MCPSLSHHGQAESLHFSTTLLPCCCLPLPFLRRTPTVIHGFTLFQYDLARAKSESCDMKRGTFLLQEAWPRSLPSSDCPEPLETREPSQGAPAADAFPWFFSSNVTLHFTQNLNCTEQSVDIP